MDIRNVIEEIIQKECELYRLKEFGLVTSVEEEVDRLLLFLPDRAEDVLLDYTVFKSWKEKVIRLFYSRLGYTEFLKANKHEYAFSRFMLFLRKRRVRQIQKEWTGDTIDSVLAIPSHTLAFKLSVMLSEEADRLLFPFIESCHSPYDLEKGCCSFCKTYYPIDLEKLLRSLRMNDKEFWEEICLLIKRIAFRVTSYLSLSNQYREEIGQDTWSDSSILFRDKVFADAIPVFDNAAHLYNYIVRICRNKCYEVMRRSRQQEISMDDLDMETLPVDSTDGSDMGVQNVDIGWLFDIDVQCDYEVSVALAFILLDKTEPWYTSLVKGVEEKVETFLLRKVQGLSYEEIALLHVPDISGVEGRRLLARLRQDVVRVRKELKERLIKILMSL